ncbi:unnamed protein product [Miscanthus lutarioriparius]|uniref:RRM domain-containing protein n=1 Tax=Miscanthus lutarioriparius TaxID=422564 RepID=A0A811RJJ9_9POAL|nr:unnamed protein product [Miscanthus lutarioriparius]
MVRRPTPVAAAVSEPLLSPGAAPVTPWPYPSIYPPDPVLVPVRSSLAARFELAQVRLAGSDGLAFCSGRAESRYSGTLASTSISLRPQLFRSAYGRIVDIDLKVPPRPPGYAFVEFEDPRDAEDAIAGRDGYNFDGHRLRVEAAHGGRGNTSSYDHSSGFGGGGGARRGVPRHSEYRGMDHMRKAGDVCFSEVYREGGGTKGIVDYTDYDDMKYAIKKLDDTKFRNAFGRAYIRVKEYDAKRGRSYSRRQSPSRSYSKSRSPSKPPRTRRSASRSRLRSVCSRSRSASKGRSPSRSPARSKSPNASPANGEAASPKKQSPSRSPSGSRSPDVK